ncbi:MAG: hypothetical protein KME27_27775 [Lyngbya sp. HA4199-MV5]|nr:hypothetical protein [Lyngbya sp. HA4199-MV5]
MRRNTDAIFAHVFRANQASDDNPKSLRLSIDTKAKVTIGHLSRGGKARTLEAKQADDHDTEWQSALVPFGIGDSNSPGKLRTDCQPEPHRQQ